MSPLQEYNLEIRLLEIYANVATVREQLAATDIGLPGRKNAFYNIYTIAEGVVGVARIAHRPGSLSFYYSPYHYRPGPGAPDTWIEIFYGGGMD